MRSTRVIRYRAKTRRRTTMSKTAERPSRFVILDSAPAKYKRFVGTGVTVCRNVSEIESVFDKHSGQVTWISCVTDLTDKFVRAVARRLDRTHRLGARKGEALLTVQ